MITYKFRMYPNKQQAEKLEFALDIKMKIPETQTLKMEGKMEKKCKVCKKKLGCMNKSGYCESCYKKSPKYREQMRKINLERYYAPGGKEEKKDYAEKHKKKIANYQKKYLKKNIKKVRIQKREWARKDREAKRREK